MEEEGKIFVGGLSWDTTEVGLKAYFQTTFGEVTNCVIMRDANTQRSRGFGFVTFHEPANVGKVLKAGTHMLDGRKIDPKPAVPRGSQPPPNLRAGGPGVPNGVGRGRTAPDGRPWPATQVVGPAAGGAVRGPYTGPTKKIFVGGLNPTTTEDDVKTFFAQHGTVTEVILKYDQTNNRMRGFGFVTFDSESSVERLVEKHYVQINTKTVEIKKAEPRNQSNPHGPFVPRSPYWGEAPSYYAYPPRGGYGPPANSAAAYYPPAAYAASPTAAYNGPGYPAYSTGAYAGSHYSAGGAGPTYGSAASYASYGTAGGYGNTSASGYESYNGTSGQGGHRSTYHGDASGYAATGTGGGAAGAYPGDAHSQAATVAYNASAAASTYGQGQSATVTSTAGDVHQYPAALYNAEYRTAAGGAPPQNYPPQQGGSPVGPGSAQGAQRAYTAY